MLTKHAIHICLMCHVLYMCTYIYTDDIHLHIHTHIHKHSNTHIQSSKPSVNTGSIYLHSTHSIIHHREPSHTLCCCTHSSNTLCRAPNHDSQIQQFLLSSSPSLSLSLARSQPHARAPSFSLYFCCSHTLSACLPSTQKCS